MNNYLIHHGILGQKWGKKNGPPYPLDFDKLSAEEKEKAKKDSIRDGNIDTANRNRKHYTNQELNELMQRFDLNRRLSSLNEKKVESGLDKMNELSKKLNTLANVSSGAINSYNNIAKLLNAAMGSDMQIIGDGKNQNKDKNNSNNDKKNDRDNYKHYVNGVLTDSKSTTKNYKGETIIKEFSKSAADKQKKDSSNNNRSHYVGPLERASKSITSYLNDEDMYKTGKSTYQIRKRIGKVKN